MNKIIRILLLPLGLLAGLVEISNRKSRDFQNKLRFKRNRIDNGCCFNHNVSLGLHARICKGVTLNNVTVGAYSYINFDCLIQHTTIGNYCSIAHGVKIGLGAHPTNLFSTSPLFYRKKNAFGLEIVKKNLEFQEYQETTIGHDVWIGANAIISDGVKVGNGVIIATGAVVTKNVPAYAIVAGVPAKIKKFRFEEEERRKYLNDGWYHYSPEEIKAKFVYSTF